MTIKHTIEDYLPAARVVCRTNPYRKGSDPVRLAKWFMGMVESNLTGPSYLATGGLVATTFYIDGSDSLDLHVKVTCDPWGIEQYLEGERNDAQAT